MEISSSQSISRLNSSGSSTKSIKSMSESGRAVPLAQEPTSAMARTSGRALAQTGMRSSVASTVAVTISCPVYGSSGRLVIFEHLDPVAVGVAHDKSVGALLVAVFESQITLDGDVGGHPRVLLVHSGEVGQLEAQVDHCGGVWGFGHAVKAIRKVDPDGPPIPVVAKFGEAERSGVELAGGLSMTASK